MENAKNILGNNLRRLIKEKGLTYADGAELLGISLAFLNNLMRNKGGASLEMIYQFAEKLNVKTSQLFEDDSSAPPSKSDLMLALISRLPTLNEAQLTFLLEGIDKIDSPAVQTLVSKYSKRKSEHG